MLELKISCPLSITLERKTKRDKKVSINLNTYRNLHFILNNNVKKKYKDIIRQQIGRVKLETPLEITYRVFKPTKRKLDKMNVVSITSKYLLDALVELKVIEDDNDDYIKKETILPTAYDKGNGRVEVTFNSICVYPFFFA